MSDTMPPTAGFAVKRVQEPAAPSDGVRVLVDRLWPRGISKKDARIDVWRKDIAPSSDLRAWFGHDPRRWTEFRRRYRSELDGNQDAIFHLAELAASDRVTLVYAAHDEVYNNARVLLEYLQPE